MLLWLARQRGAQGIWEAMSQFGTDPTFEQCIYFLAKEVYICVHWGIAEKRECTKITVVD